MPILHVKTIPTLMDERDNPRSLRGRQFSMIISKINDIDKISSEKRRKTLIELSWNPSRPGDLPVAMASDALLRSPSVSFPSHKLCPALDSFNDKEFKKKSCSIRSTDLALNALFHLFTRYEKASGAKLNVTKCHGLLIGTWQSRSNLPIALGWSNVEIIVLGSRISNDNEEQWESKIKALKTTLKACNRRALSFRGRARIANMLGLSTLWYLCTFSAIPEAIIKAVNGEVFPFAWRKKREWLARSSVTQRPNQGGLGVVDVHRKMLSLHVLWVKRLIFRPNLPWTSFFYQYIKRAFSGRSVHQILILAVPPKYAMDALPPFIRNRNRNRTLGTGVRKFLSYSTSILIGVGPISLQINIKLL